MNLSRSLCALALGIVVFSAPVFADDASPFSIGGRAADYVPTDGHGEWNGGVQARLNLPLFFGVEASVDHRHESFGATSAHDWPVQLSAMLYFLPRIVVVQPYLLAGGGWYDTTVKGPNGFSGTQDRFGPHVGAGVDFNLNSHWFLDATYQYVWLSELHTVDASGASEHIRDRGHVITAGINYRI